MTIIIYTILLLIINFFEFKKLDKLTNDDLFNILSLDILSISLYLFKYVHKDIILGIINMISIILLLYFYNKKKCSFYKTTLLLFNIFLLLKMLF